MRATNSIPPASKHQLSILLLLALLLLVIPASADTVLVKSFSDSTYMKSYMSGTFVVSPHSVGYAQYSGHSTSTVFIERDNFTDREISSNEDGYIFGTYDTNDMSPVSWSYKLADSEVSTVTGYVDWYGRYRDSSENGDTFYIYGYLYITDYTLTNPPITDNVNFFLDESPSYTLVNVDYSIVDMQESYTEVDVGYTLEYDYSYYLDFEYNGSSYQPITLNSESGIKLFSTPGFELYPDTVEVSLVEKYTEYQVFSGLKTVLNQSTNVLDTDTIVIVNGSNGNVSLGGGFGELPDNYSEYIDDGWEPINLVDDGDYTNTTILAPYYSTVYSVMNGLHTTVSSFIHWLSTPARLIIEYLGSAVNIGVSVINSVSSYIAPVGIMLSAFFGVVPDIFIHIGSLVLFFVLYLQLTTKGDVS